jgi:hypothetical protein
MRRHKNQGRFGLVGAAVVVAALAGTAACSPKSDTVAPPRQPGQPAARSAAPAEPGQPAASSAAPAEPGQPADQCARAHTWTTVPQHVGTPGSPAPVFNVRVGQHPGDCYDRVNFDLNGPDEVGYFADYVTREQVMTEGEGAPLTVPGNAFLRVVIIAPILGRDTQGHQPWRSPPKPGLQLIDPLQVRGWPTITGIVYAGGHANETAVYIGLHAKFAFHVDATWVNPETQIRIVSIDIRRPSA